MSIFSIHAGDWEGSGYGSLLYTPSVRAWGCAGNEWDEQRAVSWAEAQCQS